MGEVGRRGRWFSGGVRGGCPVRVWGVDVVRKARDETPMEEPSKVWWERPFLRTTENYMTYIVNCVKCFCSWSLIG